MLTATLRRKFQREARNSPNYTCFTTKQPLDCGFKIGECVFWYYPEGETIELEEMIKLHKKRREPWKCEIVGFTNNKGDWALVLVRRSEISGYRLVVSPIISDWVIYLKEYNK